MPATCLTRKPASRSLPKPENGRFFPGSSFRTARTSKCVAAAPARLVVVTIVVAFQILVGKQNGKRLPVASKADDILVHFDIRRTVQPRIQVAGAFILPPLQDVRWITVESGGK